MQRCANDEHDKKGIKKEPSRTNPRGFQSILIIFSAKNEKRAGALRPGLHFVLYKPVTHQRYHFCKVSTNACAAVIHIFLGGYVRIIVIRCKPQICDTAVLRCDSSSTPYQFAYLVSVHLLPHKIGKLYDFRLACFFTAGLSYSPCLLYWAVEMPRITPIKVSMAVIVPTTCSP